MLAMYGKGRVGHSVESLAKHLGIPLVLVDDTDEKFDAHDYEAVIPTPGVNPDSKAWKGNTISELDFSYRYLPKGFRICAITGTDGKSTTTWIAYNLLKKFYWEEKVFISGNFEDSFAKTVLQIREKWLTEWVIVIEISSFMAYGIGKSAFPNTLPKWERSESFTADVTIFTNFETDHLNWHGTMDEYLKAKANLLWHTKTMSYLEESILVRAKELWVELPENVTAFGADKALPNRYDDGNVILCGSAEFTLSDTNFTGKHNGFNFLSATLAVETLGVPVSFVRESLPDIYGLAHRLEFVTEKNGITFIDDSKSTSAQSLKAALESFKGKNVILIAGWSDKGDSFDHLANYFQSRVKHLVAIWATGPAFIELAKNTGIPYTSADSMSQAVKEAVSQSASGDTVLLSPGCASFGMFRDYLDRAEQFREAVKQLPL